MIIMIMMQLYLSLRPAYLTQFDINLFAVQSPYFHLLQPKSITPNIFFSLRTEQHRLLNKQILKNSNTYSIVTILHVKQQLFKHIFKFRHYKFSLNNSWPQDFGRIKPLTKLEPIKSPYKKLDLKVDYEHQNHS